MARSIDIPANGWRPRPYQRKAWAAFERGVKRDVLIWHRRAGKDEIGLNKFAVAAMERPANYWLCLPTYEQSRKAIWEGVNPTTGKKRIDEAFPREIRTRTDNSSMTIEFQGGAVWRIVGSDNPDSLVGAGPAGVIFSEWALSEPKAWGLIQPMLLENGGWASFITTPRGKNHAFTMYQHAKKMMEKDGSWFAEVLTAADTGQVSPEQIAEAKSGYVALYGEEAAEALIQQEYYCSFEAAILGAYYGKEMARAANEGRIGAVDPEPGYPVHTAWDLGASKTKDSMVIWFWQIVPTGINVLGCYANHGYGIVHYADVIKKFAEYHGCPRGTDWVPHDARQIEMGAWETNPVDPNFGKAKQRIEVMLECGLNPRKIKDHRVADGMQAVRQIFPRCRFDEVGCDSERNPGLEALRQFSADYDDVKKVFLDTPKKNWAAHYADGFRYVAMAYREENQPELEQPKTGVFVGAGGTYNGAPMMQTPAGWRAPVFNDLLKQDKDDRSKRQRY